MNAQEYQKWDTHHHIAPEFYVEAVREIGFKKIGGIAFPKWSPEASLKMMGQLNITRSFLSISTPGVYFRDDHFSRDFARKCNDYVAKLTHEYPDQFGGFGSVPLPDVNGSLKELEYSLDTLKLNGLILMTSVEGVYLGDNNYQEFFAELNRRKAIVFLHPGMLMKSEDHGLLAPIYWWQNDTTRTLIQYIRSGYHRTFPHIRFILPHGGGPLPVLYPLLVEQLKAENPDIESELETWKPQLFLDTASKGFDEQPPAILGFAGANHVLFGSDYPWANKLAGRTIANQFANLDTKQGLNQAQIQGIFKENAIKVFASPDSIPNEASPALSRPYNMMKPSNTSKVKYHYHCLPVEVVEHIKSIDGSFNVEMPEVWDSHKAIAWMARNGISKIMLSLDVPCIWNLKSYEIAAVQRMYNNTVAKIRAANPESIGVFGAINVDHLTYALSEIDYCIQELKLDGLCLYTNISATTVEQFIDPRILEKLASIDIPILVHPKNTKGIPILNENYLDALYFMAKAFYLGIYDKYFIETQLILTHTGGLVPYLAQPFNIFIYLQAKKMKIIPFLIDTYIRKKSKGYTILMNMIVD